MCQSLRCKRLTRLITLQLHFLTSPHKTKLINLRRESLLPCILALPRFYQVSRAFTPWKGWLAFSVKRWEDKGQEVASFLSFLSGGDGQFRDANKLNKYKTSLLPLKIASGLNQWYLHPVLEVPAATAFSQSHG